MKAESHSKGFIPYFCTGFLAMKNTLASVKLLEEWITALDYSKYKQDQKKKYLNKKLAITEEGIHR